MNTQMPYKSCYILIHNNFLQYITLFLFLKPRFSLKKTFHCNFTVNKQIKVLCYNIHLVIKIIFTFLTPMHNNMKIHTKLTN